MDVYEAIETTCDEVSRRSSWTLKPASESDLLSKETPGHTARLLFGFTATHDSDVSKRELLSTFYIAYSTWDGRVLYADQVDLSDERVGSTSVAFCSMAAIAETLQCTRLTWQHFERPKSGFFTAQIPETLDGWLTLHWRDSAMTAFLTEYGGSEKMDQLIHSQGWSDLSDRQKISLTLVDQSAPDGFRLRLAETSDVPSVCRLVKGLADFEKEPDAVNVTPDQYDADGFNRDRPLFYSILIETKTDSGWYTCGMALCYIGHKRDVGRFLYLEDLFIEKPYRGKSAGKCMMNALATIALSLRFSLLVWQALDWNSPALAFYKQIGAEIIDGLLTSRFKGRDLRALRDFEVK